MRKVEGLDLAEYGPLSALIGTWHGHKGNDVAPEPEGSEINPYYETIVYEGVGEVVNAEAQRLMAVHYHQQVWRSTDDKAIHNETGYWMWDKQTNEVMHSLAIPRGLCLLAGGKALGTMSDTVTHLQVAARVGDPQWGIIQAPFLRDNAKTTAFRHTLKVVEGTLSYDETMFLDIYGKTFQHTDRNELTRCTGD